MRCRLCLVRANWLPRSAGRAPGSHFTYSLLPAPGGHLPPPWSKTGPLKNALLVACNPLLEKTPLGKFLSLREGHLDTGFWLEERVQTGRGGEDASPARGRATVLLPRRPQTLSRVISACKGEGWKGKTCEPGGHSARGRVQERGRWPDPRDHERCFQRTIKSLARRRGAGATCGERVAAPIPLRQAPPRPVPACRPRRSSGPALPAVRSLP